ncbi:hypothetical protein CGCSCA5_v010426 [Colletotrichum siamense]|nr:hypothetical protein CGCSCA5_v010426 [Colletotrichum siamense]KAF4879722.1 hypothetical protein CGCSCA1_v001221 [Colletotrichum siamense]
MAHLSEAGDELKENWIVVASSTERRRQQNRLNQRARKKRHLERCEAAASNFNPESRLVAKDGIMSDGRTERDYDSKRGHSNVHNTRHDWPLNYILLHCPKSHEKAAVFVRSVIASCSINGPRPSNLPILARLNVINALAINALTLNFPFEKMYSDECISPFNIQGPRPQDAATLLLSVPDGLRPTALQTTIQHHPWIDLFPIPVMRDNILRGIEAGTINKEELCGDMMRVEDADDAVAPFAVWGEAWDVRGWEISTAFLTKWGWLVQGCPEVLEATKFWRERRGRTKGIKMPQD